MSAEVPSKVTGLTKRSLAGTGWSGISTVGKQLLTIASVTTVARILGPAAYGLMGMAVIVTNFVSNFRDLGTAMAIVQRPTVTRTLLSSLFWINLLMGFSMFLAVSGTAPLVATFFHAPELTNILRALAFSLFIASCGVVHSAVLNRDMSFKALAMTDLVAAAVSYAVALTGAWTGLGVWSLVFASVANSLCSSLGYWLTASFRPRWEFDIAEVKSIAKFSSNLSGFGLVNYVCRNADNLIVGRRLGSIPLGYYQMAYNLMLTPIQNISSVISGVLFPAFARIQDDNERFRHAYVRACMLTALITFPVMAGLGIVADPLIRAMLGKQWVATIPIFQILSVVGLIQSVQTTVGIIYQAKGRTDWMFRWSLLVLAVTLTAFLIGVQFGAVGVAWGYALCFVFILMVPGFWFPFRLIDLSILEFGRAMFPQLAVTASMVAVCGAWLVFLDRLGVYNAMLRLISTCLIGASAYVAGLWMARPPVLEHLGEIMANSEQKLLVRALFLMQRLRLVRQDI